MRAQITLKSGAQIEVDVDELETSRNGYSRELSKVEWTTPEGWTRKLHAVEIDQISAIVIIADGDHA